MALERLQKILARAGVSSRRAAEELITDGRVRVNGRIVSELGSQADGRRDRIEVDGRRVVLEHPAYYILHKPRGVVSTLRDPEGRPSLGDILGRFPERLFPVGRLDFHTSGALLVTNDGELAEALLHPSRKVPKVYVAKLRGDVDTGALEALRNGVELDDGHMTAPADVIVLREESGSTWVRITIHEGRNRQIVRMGDAVGHPVSRLARLSFAGIDTDRIRPGEIRPLEEKEVEKLKTAYLVPARARRLGQKRSAAHAARQAARALEEVALEGDGGPLEAEDAGWEPLDLIEGADDAGAFDAEALPPASPRPRAPTRKPRVADKYASPQAARAESPRGARRGVGRPGTGAGPRRGGSKKK